MMNTPVSDPDFAGQFHAARFIKEIGRGKEGARSLTSEQACQLYTAMLESRVSDLELGAILLSMRIKGESVDEITGFMAAAHASLKLLRAPDQSQYAPVIIPSYNGARKKANLTPLLALLLAKSAVPVLLHGVEHDAGRVTTAEILQILEIPAAHSVAHAESLMAQQIPAFMPIHVLSPSMARLLDLRKVLGVRNSTHTLVKLLQVFAEPALRLCSYTHPEYLLMLRQYFTLPQAYASGGVFLMRATEGEAVANAARAQQIDWWHQGIATTLCETQSSAASIPELPESIDAASTAAWIQEVVAGRIAVPENIAAQVEFIKNVTCLKP